MMNFKSFPKPRAQGGAGSTPVSNGVGGLLGDRAKRRVCGPRERTGTCLGAMCVCRSPKTDVDSDKQRAKCSNTHREIHSGQTRHLTHHLSSLYLYLVKIQFLTIVTSLGVFRFDSTQRV